MDMRGGGMGKCGGGMGMLKRWDGDVRSKASVGRVGGWRLS